MRGGPQIAQRGRIEVLEGVDGGKRQPHLARGDADHGGDLEQLEADGGALRLGHGRAGQAHLLLLDAVLHLAAGAVDLLVQPLRRLDFGEFQVGHHEARIGALPQVLGLADHAPLAAPRAVRAIAELAEAAHRLAGLPAAPPRTAHGVA